MFGIRKNSSKQLTESSTFNNPITMTLNGLKFAFDVTTNVWKIEKTELEKVADAMNHVLDERDALLLTLQDAMQQIKDLKEEMTEINRNNKAALDMLKEEKQKNHMLQQQIDGYRNELSISCETIASLRLENNVQ